MQAEPPSGGPAPGTPGLLTAPPRRDLGLLAIALAGVSASGPIMAATAAPALAIAFWRNALGSGLTGLSALVQRRGGRPSQFTGIDRASLRLAVVGGLFLAVHFGTWVPSVTLTSVASATALVATQAVFSALIAAAWGQRLSPTAWAGMGVALIGTALIAGADFGVSARALTGDGLAVVGGAAAAAYVSVGAVVRRTMTATAYTTVCYGVCSAGLLVVCVLGRQPLGGYHLKAWLLIVAVTISAQLLGHTMINVVLRSVSATFVGLAILFEVPGAAIIAAIWLKQTPTVWAIPGLVLLLAGLVVTVRSRPVVTQTVDVD